MKVIIIGAGNTGLSLTNILGENYDVTLIEKEEDIAKQAANKTTAMVINVCPP